MFWAISGFRAPTRSIPGARRDVSRLPSGAGDPLESGHQWSEIGNVVAHREAHDIDHGMGVELAHNARTVRLDRLGADLKRMGDLPIARPFGQELNDFALAPGQEVGAASGPG